MKFDGYVIISDLDGTLLDNEKKLSSENKKAINYFTSNGGKFTIATGRTLEGVSEYIEDIKLDLPIVLYNGGIIYDTKYNKVVKEQYVSDFQKDIAFKIYEDYKDIGIQIYCGSDIYVLRDYKYVKRQSTKNLNIIYEVPDNIRELNWNTILLMGELSTIEQIEETFEEKYKCKIVRSSNRFLEVLPQMATKGYALNEIVQMYDIDKKKIIAIGDNMNDLHMLNEAHISFCPANASDRVKSNVDFVTSVSNEGPVIKEILEKIDFE